MNLSREPPEFNETVSGLRVVVHYTGQRRESLPSDGSNHTTQYYLLRNNRSVQLNMATAPRYINGIFAMEVKRYHQSPSTTLFNDRLRQEM